MAVRAPMAAAPAIMPNPASTAVITPPGKPANGPATMIAPPPMNRPMAAMKKPNSTPTTVIRLGAIDILILLPILMGVIGALFGFFMAAIGLFIGGGVIMIAGPIAGFPGGVLTAILAGLGMMAGATAIAALTAIVTILLVNATVWYARLHYRLLKPALEPHAQA